MNVHPLKALWSIGHIASICETTTADVEAVAAELGITEADLSINGVDYLTLAAGALIEEHIQKRRGQAPHPAVAKATAAAARAFNAGNQ